MEGKGSEGWIAVRPSIKVTGYDSRGGGGGSKRRPG